MHPLAIGAITTLQAFVVVFVALHDWVPLGNLNNLAGVHQSDASNKPILVTAMSTLPFAVGFVASAFYGNSGFPVWLMWWLWITYGIAAYGMLRTWWIPYLLFEELTRVARYRTRFAGTHAFLPIRHGIRPDTLHCVLHGVIVVILILLCVLSSPGR